MNVHKNARTTRHSRAELVRRVQEGQAPRAVATALGIDLKTVNKWVGRFAAEGSPAELIAQYSTREVLELRFIPGAQTAAEPLVNDMAERIEVLPDRLLLYATDGEDALTKVLATGLRPVSTLVRRSTLEDVFLRLTGRSLVD